MKHMTMTMNLMPLRWQGAAAVAVAAACGWYLALQCQAPRIDAGTLASAPPAASVVQVGRQRMLFDVVETSRAGAPAPLSKARQIDRWSASGNARDAYAAYQVAAACKRTQEAQRRGEALADGALAAACGDITQRQLMGMGQNLEKAALAGIPGAVQELLEFGPLDGDASALETRPTDPLVVSWKHHMQDLFAASARRGDLESMATLSQAYQVGYFEEKDAGLALAYEIARHELLMQSTDARHVGMLRNGVRLGDLSAGMTQEQIAAATAFGRRLVAECCKRQAQAPAYITGMP
jgi:hypothetical protein